MIAAYILLLSRYQQTGRVRLWLLPGLMFLWVNLHLGFVFGLVLIGAYVGFGALQTAWGMEGASARQRLRAAMPWFALTFAATFANPYGPWVYEALWHQYRDGPWSAGLGEWSQIPFPTWALLERVFVPGDPRGQIYAAFAIGLILVAIAVWRRRFGAAFALAGAVVLTAEFQRLVAFLAIVSVVVGPDVGWRLGANRVRAPVSRQQGRAAARRAVRQRGRGGLWHGATNRVALAITATALVIVFGYAQTRLLAGWAMEPPFEARLSYEVPKGAISFIERERVPGNIVTLPDSTDTSLGAYFTWRLYPAGYLDFTDARWTPFRSSMMVQAINLANQPPDAPVWQQLIERYTVNAIVTPPNWDRLRSFCDSNKWAPVYIDELSAVFVRQTAANEELIARLKIDCLTAPIAPNVSTSHEKWCAAALQLEQLARYPEAIAAAREALELMPDHSFYHVVLGQLLEKSGDLAAAEREYRAASAIIPDSATLELIAGIARHQHRVEDEIAALRAAVDVAWGFSPATLLAQLANAEMRAGHPREAQEAIARALSLAVPLTVR
jgi:tetratricopeptide (TPR) repeat protein